jgi:hypothetical protein
VARRRTEISAAAAVVVAVAAVALVFGSSGGPGSTAAPAPPRQSPTASTPLPTDAQPKAGVWLVDANMRRVVRTIPTSGPIGSVFVGGGHAWMGDSRGVRKMNAQTGQYEGHVRLQLAGGVGPVAYMAGSLWVMQNGGTLPDATAVYRLNPRTHRSTRIAVSHSYVDVYAGAGSVWVPGDRWITRINPRSGRVSDRLPIGLSQPHVFCAVTFGAGAMWIASAVDPNRDMLLRVDPRTDRITQRIPIPETGAPSYCATAAAGAVWVMGTGTHVYEYNEHTGKPIGLLTGRFAWMAGTPSDLWITTTDDPTAIHEVNADRTTISRIRVPFQPPAFFAFGRTVWAEFARS